VTRPGGGEPEPRPGGERGLDRLAEPVRRWIHERGWRELRPIQEAAVEPLSAADRDVVLAASTAAGKTEAAFLPIVSALVRAPAASIQALYVSPLKALINDQHRRLDELCGACGVPVHRWHGDVRAKEKRSVLDEPRGVLQITPESLEALFCLRGGRIPELFRELRWIVIDEMHAFLVVERGKHLQSLMHRLELALERRVARVGLSATLGDLTLAADFVRPGAAGDVTVVEAPAGEHELQLQLRGYREDEVDRELVEPGQPLPCTARRAIARDLFERLRGADHLVFANSKKEVELLAAELAALSEARRVPNEFWPHHGSLSRELREEVEARLKEHATPITAICTSTLEMGIDVGDVKSVVQLGAPPDVAALRQRLGRSGRRGEPSILRVLVRERALGASTALEDRLRAELVEAIAAVELLLAGWCEPPSHGGLHLSTLIHQVLSSIAQHGGLRADALWRTLCRDGPFRDVDPETFGATLRAMGAADLIAQLDDGELVIGLEGERRVGHYTFYSAFKAAPELRVVHAGRAIGTVPGGTAISAGASLVLGGQRWRVESVDEGRGTVAVAPGAGGKPPSFRGGPGRVHDRVRQAMRALYAGSSDPVFLDDVARGLLDEARDAFGALGLRRRRVVQDGDDALFCPWRGDAVLTTIALALRTRGLDALATSVAVRVRELDRDELTLHLAALRDAGLPDATTLACEVRSRAEAKFDEVLTEELSCRDWASRHVDVAGATAVLNELGAS